MDENENLLPRRDDDETLKREFKQRNRWLLVLAEAFQRELTVELQQLYVTALIQVPMDQLRKAMAVGIWRWRFFPSLAEIREAIDEATTDVVGHQRAYERLKQEYELAYREGRMVTSLPSLQDVPPDVIQRLAGEVMTRGQLIAAGLEQPRVMSPDAILAEVRKQTEGLLIHVKAQAEGVGCTCYRCAPR